MHTEVLLLSRNKENVEKTNIEAKYWELLHCSYQFLLKLENMESKTLFSISFSNVKM